MSSPADIAVDSRSSKELPEISANQNADWVKSFAADLYKPPSEVNASAQHYAVQEAIPSMAVQPPPTIPEALTETPYDSSVKLNVQITNAPDITPIIKPEEVVPFLAAGTETTIKGSKQLAVHLSHRGAANNDFAGIAAHFAQNPFQFNRDVSEVLGRRLTLKEQASFAVPQAAMGFFMNGRMLDEETIEQMGLRSMDESGLKTLGVRTEAGTEEILHSVPINGADRICPFGFKDEQQFLQAAKELRQALKESGITDAEVGVRGSSVTGYSDYKNTHFHAGSNVDFYVESDQLCENFYLNNKGMAYPDDITEKFRLLRAWSEKWREVLGHDITPAGWGLGKVPTETPAIKVE